MPTGSQHDDDDFDGDEGNLIAQLRKALKAKDKELEGIRGQFSELANRDRQRTLSEALTTAGMNPKVARFYPNDGELSDTAIGEWIKDNAEVFGGVKPVDETPAPGPGEGAAPSEQQAETSTAVDPLTEAAFLRLRAAQLVGGQPSTRESELLRAMHDAKSPDDLAAVLNAPRA